MRKLVHIIQGRQPYLQATWKLHQHLIRLFALKIGGLEAFKILECLLDASLQFLERLFIIWQRDGFERWVDAGRHELDGVGQAVDLEPEVLHIWV